MFLSKAFRYMMNQNQMIRFALHEKLYEALPLWLFILFGS